MKHYRPIPGVTAASYSSIFKGMNYPEKRKVENEIIVVLYQSKQNVVYTFKTICLKELCFEISESDFSDLMLGKATCISDRKSNYNVTIILKKIMNP